MQSSKVNISYLLFTVFISGLTSLGLEMAASRLLGNVFGTSNLVWASIIGLILIYLTVGYWLGGKWADNHPEPVVFFQLLVWTGISIAVVPLVSQPVLRFAADAFDKLQLGIMLGAFVSVMILLLIPMVLLGTASPFAIRLSIQDASSSGKISGKIYAISTIGSFIGTFIATLVLIPLIGTYRTFMVFALLLSLTSITGLLMFSRQRKYWLYSIPIAIIAILLLLGRQVAIKQTTGQLYETESAYNYIQVLQEDGYNLLRLNEGQGVHSIYKPGVDNYYGPWEQFMVGPFFNQAPVSLDQIKSIAIVGLAGGTAARASTKVFGAIPIDGFEIDPKIIEIGQKYFGMNEPGLRAIPLDGRWGLEHSNKKYSIIAVDAYRPPYIPWHLTTREFFQIGYDHLLPDGVLVINVGRSPNDRRLINDLSSTLATVFSSVYVADIPESFNSMIFATKLPTETNNLLNNYISLSANINTPPLLLETMQITVANIMPVIINSRVYTDDLAPIEWVTNDMVVRYILTDNPDHP
jgi:predicted membrane-bound spermidine synthase